MKRPTMKDIAEKAGVSTATVSYVLNYSEKQTISHEMRLKIFQIAQELNYVPNMQAKSLAKATVQNKSIGFVFEAKLINSASSQYILGAFLSKLQVELAAMNIEVVPIQVDNFIDNVKIIHDKFFDCLLVLNFNQENSELFTTNFYIPILFLGGNVKYDIFRRLSIDYQFIFTHFIQESQGEKRLLLSDSSVDETLIEHAKNYFELEENLDSYEDYVRYIKQNRITTVLALNEIIALQLEREFSENELKIFCIITNKNQTLVRESTRKILLDNEIIIDHIKDSMVFFTDWKSNIWEGNKKLIKANLIN